MEKPDAGGGKLHVLKNENSSTDKRKTIMALIVYNRENSRPQEVTYKGKRTINLDSRGTVYLSKTMSIELGILGGGREFSLLYTISAIIVFLLSVELFSFF